MKRVLLLILICSALIFPAFGQSVASGWKYQMQLSQGADGHILISYFKKILPADFQTAAPGDEAIYVSPATFQVSPPDKEVITGSDASEGNDFQVTRNYFLFLNQHIPPVISLPEPVFNKHFPSPTHNQSYPMPDGN